MRSSSDFFTAIDWRRFLNVAPRASAMMAALSFDRSARESVVGLGGREWEAVVEHCDRQQVTLLVAERVGSLLPARLRQRIERDRINQQTRRDGLWREYGRIADALDSAGLPHVLLKGFSQVPEFVSDAALRPQYDLDLLLTREAAGRARELLEELGYESLVGRERFPTDHLPPLVRKTGWEWRGDYFDPEIPPVVELHFRFWDAATERFELPGLSEFWERRALRELDARAVPCLQREDTFAYAAIHALRHLLRGNLKALHVFELAWFLDTQVADEDFWNRWVELHPPSLREYQAISLGLARRWFGCRLPAAVEESVSSLPADVRLWLAHHAAAPAIGSEAGNKQELWLHLQLLSSRRDRWAVARRRLFPLTMPGPIEGVFSADRGASWQTRVGRWLRYARYVAARCAFHALALLRVAREGLRWRRLLRNQAM